MTSRLGRGKLLTFFYSVGDNHGVKRVRFIIDRVNHDEDTGTVMAIDATYNRPTRITCTLYIMSEALEPSFRKD